MYCKNCGKEINDKAVVCINCGVAVAPLTPALKPAPLTPAEGKGKNVCSVVGFVFACLGVVGTIFSLIGLILSIIGLAQSGKCRAGKGLGIAGIIVSVCAFFVHGVIMMYLMPYLIKLIGGTFMMFMLFFIIL